MIALSGVRSSCDSTAMKSSFMRLQLLGGAARDALAVEQLLALLLERDALGDVAGDRHVDARLDVRRDAPLEVDQLAVRIDERKLVRRAAGVDLAGERIDAAAPIPSARTR